MTTPVVLSHETALALPYATSRLAQRGWRVIRLEAPPGTRGSDPNRRVGPPVAGDDRCAYFIGPNAGKESVAVDLGHPDGRSVVRRLVCHLGVDVFCTNARPRTLAGLGLDAERLRSARPELVWVGLSARGPDEPDAAGYDPAVQAESGAMAVNGHPDGPPTLCGLPVADLRAGDEVVTEIAWAMAERARTGQGTRVDVALARALVPWLVNVVPLLDCGVPAADTERRGNRHPFFVPVGVYAAADGHVLLAVGSDAQWATLTALPGFTALASASRATNAGRLAEREAIDAALTAAIATRPVATWVATWQAAGLVAAPVRRVAEAAAALHDAGWLARTVHPDGRPIRLAGPASGPLPETPLSFPPAAGADTDRVLAEAGFPAAEREALRAAGTIV